MVFSLMALLVPAMLVAQDEAFIYGKVSTKEGNTYEGPIRWGKEEVYWTDLFNASKEENENLRYLSTAQRDKLDEQQAWAGGGEGSFSSFIHTIGIKTERYFFNSSGSYLHQFGCQFGEIRSISPEGRRYMSIEMQNGDRFTLDGEGYNDVGPTIHVLDKSVGEIAVEWNRIERVTFMPTPRKLAATFGEPLYGTVESYDGSFTGYIQWDHDERISTDKLDGDADDGKMTIPFEKIRSIERRAGHSIVILKSGREVELRGSNDVSHGHRGIIVMDKTVAAIDIPWDEFRKVVFTEKAPEAIVRYDDFKTQKPLQGKVTTHDGKTVSGQIVYDLDEMYNYDLLQGKDDDIKFAAPFRNIRRITVKTTSHCEVELTNGKRLTLRDEQDVNNRNQGLLITTGTSGERQYIPWTEVEAIEFQ